MYIDLRFAARAHKRLIDRRPQSDVNAKSRQLNQ